MLGSRVLAAAALVSVAMPTVGPSSAQTPKSGAPADKCDLTVPNVIQVWPIRYPGSNLYGAPVLGIKGGEVVEARVLDTRKTDKTTMFYVEEVKSRQKSWVDGRILYFHGEMAKRLKIRKIRAEGGDPCTVFRQEADAARAQQAAQQRERTKRACNAYVYERNRKLGAHDLVGNGMSQRQSLRAQCCDSRYTSELGFARICS